MKASSKNITIPKKNLYELLEIGRKFEDAKEKIEDYLMSKDQLFIKKLKKARNEHKKGNLINVDTLKEKYV